MNKELIELQRGCKSTCVIILDDYYKELDQAVVMNSNIKDEYLFSVSFSNVVFKEKLESLASNSKLTYFIIRNIDNLNENDQEKYISLIKDREFNGYTIPDNVIIILTVKSKDNLKNISSNLYHFAVIAI